MAKETVAPKPITKSQLIAAIAEETKLAKKDIMAILDSLNTQIGINLSKKGPGVFVIPGMIKIEKKRVPAKKAQKNAPNPFKPGEFRDIPAKPAHDVVKVRALKALKDMVK